MMRQLTIPAALLLAGCVGTQNPNHYAAYTADSINLDSFMQEQEQPEWTKTALNNAFKEWEAVRYRFGGLSKDGIDCSGFVYMTFLHQFGVKLPRNTLLQARLGETVPQDQLQAGDLVFFKTGHSRTGRHVGIYLENGLFMHASASYGVTTSSLESGYWANAYWTAKRLDTKLLHRS